MGGYDEDSSTQTETRWLDTDQQQAWLTLIALVTRLPAALDAQLQRDSALTHFEYFVLASLSGEDNHRLQLSLLAQRANASLSRLSHVITKMEKAGWVRRESIRGSRGSDAVLTDAGMAKVVDAAPPHVESVRALVFDGLSTDQVRQLSELGSAMLTQLDKGIAAGTGRA
ncbi:MULTISPECIES: MarR family winged helix-turn-helix transcriptional regulator [Rhodococcus]|uniref:MarR family transcriptional regulator n=1 Tax=Rhodococcus oxybenzonivorans TaxID=1990687 RepID=A0AAE4UUG3_9NOCA|nr:MULTISPECIES: MarR family transcriptional regulator [Rhodococcus]MDV7244093.1 MarR family transcriptional regulator [Rhodococcus oxybenzonivorans]MDV7263126.1 MarR family transcriptional regulator [Rhodococcus oxybenzonivorans]MDV7274665.1 MarR family transcriptional regulator [Rhodococcus oxybenzonivorans]MDV7335978.1 MarR family transcriptional regulator [Rhodococcus oxybenzonivorans]MDV7345615.1 MarR family transcriptional regulator [Rhodococcus oxybenzonivorans]